MVNVGDRVTYIDRRGHKHQARVTHVREVEDRQPMLDLEIDGQVPASETAVCYESDQPAGAFYWKE